MSKPKISTHKFLKTFAWILDHADHSDLAENLYNMAEIHKRKAEDSLEEGGTYEEEPLNDLVPIETMYKCLLASYHEVLAENKELSTKKGVAEMKTRYNLAIQDAEKYHRENKKLLKLLKHAHDVIVYQAQKNDLLKTQKKEVEEAYLNR